MSYFPLSCEECISVYPCIHITVVGELKRIRKKVVWAFKDDFDNNIYIEELIVNIIYLGMLLFCNIPRHFIGYVNKGLPWWLRW